MNPHYGLSHTHTGITSSTEKQSFQSIQIYTLGVSIVLQIY